MGRPKALLVLDGETLLARQLRVLRRVTKGATVVGRFEGLSEGLEMPPIADVLPGRGPLAGIYSGLLRTTTEYNMFLGCDLPYVDRQLLAFVAVRALEIKADVTVPRSLDGRLQPLCAVYRRRARYSIRTTLGECESRITAFFPRVLVNVIAWPELARAGFPASIFANMNTPEDFRLVARRLNPVEGAAGPAR